MTEHIALRFDWDDVLCSRVTEILGFRARTMNDGSASWDAVAICTERKSILLSVEPDTDQVEVTLCEKPCGDEWHPIQSFAFAIGEAVGWCWVGRNYLGYKDCFTLAFGGTSSGVQPRCTFLAAASSLSCLDLSLRKA